MNFDNIKNSFVKNFITDDRWLQLLKGLGVTLEITFFAAILGIIIGFIIAAVRSTYDKNLSGKKVHSLSDFILKFFNTICNIYLTVIRGTPVVVQLMIIHFIVLSSVRNGIYAAIVAFGINSGAYVAEIVRSGIMSIDKGQFEAGRSLGFNYIQTMWYIVFPQAFKNILPALGNEFIVLIKETSVAGYVALKDITYVGNLIRSRTYEAFFPLITVAVIYLAIVMILSHFLKKLERRLRNSDH
ncbi:MAG: amino acid ABC transporter permease [Clostridia bacterium]|nr:amino acid ABC transporter permease [Clostridia bacterium]